jgi:hypothetical protein
MSDVIQFPKIVMADAMAKYGLTDTDGATANIEMSDLYAPVQKRAPADSQHTKSDTVTAFMQDSISAPVSVDATGWSNQELANLYRAQRILTLTGISIDVDHGITDEGDPWFIFMDSQDEVFAHFSHFDGLYMVSSLVQEKPIKGRSLQDLISQFSELAKPATADAGAGQNIVSIVGRNSNVVLIHPAAALAALVWSIYLMSDGLVAAATMMTEEASEDNANTGVSTDFQNFTNILDVEPEIAQKAVQVLSDAAATKQVADQHFARDSVGAPIAAGMSVKALGIGLSFVALSVGLPMPLGITDDTDSDVTLKQLSINKLAELLVEAQEIAAVTMAATDTALLQHTDLLDHMDDETFAQTPLAADVPDVDGNIDLADIVKNIKAPSEVNTQYLTGFEQKSDSRAPLAAEADVPPEMTEAKASTQDSAGVIDNAGFLKLFDAAFESFALTDLSQINRSEMNELLSASHTVDTLDVIIGAEEVQQYDAYDQNAQMFLDYLLRTHNSDMKVVSLPTEVIFIYIDAADVASDNYELYSKSWSFDDGGIITTVGLKSDMELFDLVA